MRMEPEVLTNSNNSKTIRFSRLFLYVGAFGSIIFALFWYFSIRQEGLEAWGFHLVYGFLILIGIILIASYLNYQISYDKMQFTVRNIFRIRHTYRYDQITEIRIDPVQGVQLAIGKKAYTISIFHTGAVLSFGKMMTGGNELLNLAVQGLRQKYGEDYKDHIKHIQRKGR